MLQEIDLPQPDDLFNKIKTTVDDYLSGPKFGHWRSARSITVAKEIRSILQNKHYNDDERILLLFKTLHLNTVYLNDNRKESRLRALLEGEYQAIMKSLKLFDGVSLTEYKQLLNRFRSGQEQRLEELFTRKDSVTGEPFLHRLLTLNLFHEFFKLYGLYLEKKGGQLAAQKSLSDAEIFSQLVSPLQATFNDETVAVRLSSKLDTFVTFYYLAEGYFAEVKCFRLCSTGCDNYVIKEPRELILQQPLSVSVDDLKKEFVVMVLASSVSQFVVPAVTCLLEKKMFSVVMPMASRSNLTDYCAHYKFNHVRLREFMIQIATATDVLHSINIIHCDIKPHNVLIFFDEVSRKMVAKLADFGLSKRYINDEDILPKEFVGTDFFSPSAHQRKTALIYKREPYKAINYRQVDVYALLATMIFLSMGELMSYEKMDNSKVGLEALASSDCNEQVDDIVHLCSPVFFKKKSAGFVKDYCLKHSDLFKGKRIV